MTSLLFVYGTLKQGGQLHHELISLGTRFISPARTQGELFRINPYEKALAMEKQKRTLQQNVFIILVDNLGYAYAVSGDIPKSMDTLRYGITVEPEYPLFHYNLACGYGELRKLDESLQELRLAFKYKANMFSGERFPDPLKDSSFKKFLSDKKFVDAVRQMQQEP